MKIFHSYSHADKWALERLHKHLSVLRREDKIADWYDRDILAGDEVDEEISARLDECDLFLPLVSPDFLASNYCYEREMERAIARHEAGEMRIVPVIVEPCDWKSSPLQRFKALPLDGKPITEWTNQNNAFLDIVMELRRLIPDEVEDETDTGSGPAAAAPDPQERTYRLKKDFDEIDRGEFRKVAFETIRDFFEASVTEINAIDGIKARFEAIGSHGFTCTVLNQGLPQQPAHITVHSATDRYLMGDIYHSFSENAAANTAQGGFQIDADAYELFLVPHDFGDFGYDKKLSPKQAGEKLWIEFIEQAGISID